MEIESGHHKSVNEVIRSGLRILEEERRKIELINEAIEAGETSGKPNPFDNGKFKSKTKKKPKPDA